MGNFGMGIGAFMEGLTSGMKTKALLDKEQRDSERADRLMTLRENADARDAKASDLNLKKAQSDMDWQEKDRAYTQSERAADAPVRAVQRKSAIDDLNFKESERAADAPVKAAQRQSTIDDINYQKSERAAEAPVKAAQRQSTIDDLEFKKSERTADAPVKEAQRKSVLGGLQDSEELRQTQKQGVADADKAYKDQRAKSIVVGKDDAGNDTFTVDGQKAGSQAEADKMFEQRHGSFMEAYRTNIVPKVQQAYLARGDLKSAEAWQKWNEDERVKKGIDLAGRLEGSFRAGDWDGVGKHFNSLAQSKDYMALGDVDVKAEPIKGDDGKTVGLKATYTDKKSNTTRTEEFKDMDALHTALMGAVNPASVFEYNKQQLAAVQAAKIDTAKENRKLANDIDLKRVESALKIGEERAKQGFGDPKSYSDSVIKQVQSMGENDLAFSKKSPEEQVAAADAIVSEAYRRAGRARPAQAVPGAAVPPAQPAARSLWTRPPIVPGSAPY